MGKLKDCIRQQTVSEAINGEYRSTVKYLQCKFDAMNQIQSLSFSDTAHTITFLADDSFRPLTPPPTPCIHSEPLEPPNGKGNEAMNSSFADFTVSHEGVHDWVQNYIPDSVP